MQSLFMEYAYVIKDFLRTLQIIAAIHVMKLAYLETLLHARPVSTVLLFPHKAIREFVNVTLDTIQIQMLQSELNVILSVLNEMALIAHNVFQMPLWEHRVDKLSDFEMMVMLEIPTQVTVKAVT